MPGTLAHGLHASGCLALPLKACPGRLLHTPLPGVLAHGLHACRFLVPPLRTCSPARLTR